MKNFSYKELIQWNYPVCCIRSWLYNIFSVILVQKKLRAADSILVLIDSDEEELNTEGSDEAWYLFVSSALIGCSGYNHHITH